ncbi:hypothetical protein LCGC14_1334470 [marine sediment metagenome]|uniref:Uncharacterized protein n=1 Tax=marine sediment metagenome TaxID=412755 RepID=A0A0F9NI28_9ZZZZ
MKAHLIAGNQITLETDNGNLFTIRDVDGQLNITPVIGTQKTLEVRMRKLGVYTWPQNEQADPYRVDEVRLDIQN